ncbi:hypothetical protein [Pontibacter sp. SGAir0037]|uniref:hypothetical protein n=1 Tax=Pontibacter sp. SGAir0037 TaxID=2571030 RepID=UPI0010CD0D94|nr:hypothetical protein [Pontibacter sp. SGAir0037]QCR21622.1 hypothetical protein C1N53_04190 [Pontibacter sp. SGAir0037]
MKTDPSFEKIDYSDLPNLLEKSGLKKTSPRLLVLAFIASRREATSKACIARALENRMERSTLHRLLITLVKKNVLCKVLDANGTPAYIFAPQHENGQQQIHFNCTRCNNFYFLQEHRIQPVKLPKGFL